MPCTSYWVFLALAILKLSWPFHTCSFSSLPEHECVYSGTLCSWHLEPHLAHNKKSVNICWMNKFWGINIKKRKEYFFKTPAFPAWWGPVWNEYLLAERHFLHSFLITLPFVTSPVTPSGCPAHKFSDFRVQSDQLCMGCVGAWLVCGPCAVWHLPGHFTFLGWGFWVAAQGGRTLSIFPSSTQASTIPHRLCSHLSSSLTSGAIFEVFLDQVGAEEWSWGSVKHQTQGQIYNIRRLMTFRLEVTVKAAYSPGCCTQP